MNDALRRQLVEGEQAGQRYALSLPRRTLVGTSGAALGHRTGSSLEFRDYRSYEPGDDLRHIDWNAYARSDLLSVKMFREEVTPHTDILIDGSRSMVLEGTEKGRAALALAGFFAAAAGNAGYTHRAWLLADTARQVANGNGPPATWDAIEFEHRGSPAECFAHAAPAWKPRGMRVLLSDLLWEGDPVTAARQLADRAAVTIVVQVLAEADANPVEGGSVRLVDSETDEVHEIILDAAAAHRYREALRRHQENWNQACRQVGAVFATVIAEDVVRDWKLDALVAAEVLKVV